MRHIRTHEELDRETGDDTITVPLSLIKRPEQSKTFEEFWNRPDVVALRTTRQEATTRKETK